MHEAAANGALVLFSGGQDSTTCLAWALARFAHVETAGFNYGQRHAVELECRGPVRENLRKINGWGAKLGPDHLIDLGGALAEIGGTAMTHDIAIEMTESGLPNTFVPGRNLLFLTYAAAIAYRRGLKHIVTGVCETDFSGYPDCRDDTIKAMQLALNLGMDRRFVLHTPLMWIDKAATWALAAQLGGAELVQTIVDDTHTCYRGDHTTLHEWGYGCNTCPACELRAAGYRKWAVSP
jgi:7-cyano-7-deazaguanine synthase